MTTPDTLDLDTQPFYLWDSIPYDMEANAPDPGVAVDSAYTCFLVPDHGIVIDSFVRPSIFAGHSLSVGHDSLATRPDAATPMWVFPLLLLLVTLVTLYHRLNKLRFGTLLNALVDSHAMDRMLRNNNLTRTVQLIPAGLLMVATLTLPVHQLAMAHTGFVGYLLLTLAVAGAYLLRNGLIRLLGTIFDDEGAVGLYITSNYLYHLTLATLAMPLLFPLFYLPFGRSTLYYILLALVAIGFIVRIFRGLKLFLTQSSGSHFYLFYYLCIVELAPILVLVKWIVE